MALLRHRQRRPGGACLRGQLIRTRWRGWCSTPRCRWVSPPRPRWNSASRANRPRWTPGPRSARPPTARWARPEGRVDALLAAARDTADGPGGASVATVADAISTALAYPRGDRVAAANGLAVGGRGGALRRHQPDDQPDHPGRDAAQHRRPVRQQLQRRPEPADPRPGPRTGRGVGQALPAVRHRRRTRTRQMPELAQRVSPAGPEEPRRSRCCCSVCRTTRSSATKAWPPSPPP